MGQPSFWLRFLAKGASVRERRLAAKRAGDKPTSDALKLVLNSCFGAFNYAYSPLYSPDAFLAITVSGQLCLLALAERIKGQNTYV